MTSMVNRGYALDASALLALLQNEPGHENVRKVLGKAWIHAVNAAEVIGKLMRVGAPKNIAAMAVHELQLDIVEEFNFQQAEACGTLIAGSRSEGLSLGDCVCLTAAAWRGSEVVTAERLWKKFDGRVVGGARLRIRLIR